MGKKGLSIGQSFQTLTRHQMFNTHSLNQQIFIVCQTLFQREQDRQGIYPHGACILGENIHKVNVNNT